MLDYNQTTSLSFNWNPNSPLYFESDQIYHLNSSLDFESDSLIPFVMSNRLSFHFETSFVWSSKGIFQRREKMALKSSLDRIDTLREGRRLGVALRTGLLVCLTTLFDFPFSHNSIKNFFFLYNLFSSYLYPSMMGASPT